MAEDIAPELLEKVQSEYRKLRENDAELARIREKTAAGSADGKDLDAYAVREGELLAEALRNNVSGDVLPNGKMYFNIADRVLPPVLEEDYAHVADMSERIQQSLNNRAGIHIRAQRPDLEEDRVKGLVNLAATADQYDDIHKQLEGDVVNFSQSVATNSVRKNADFQYKSGLSPKIVRTAAPGCCKWCTDLAGTYDYATVKASGNEVWQRHRGCGCVVEYDPGNGSRQNVHTKKRYDWKEENEEKTASRKEYDELIPIEGIPRSWEQAKDDNGEVRELSLAGTNPNYNHHAGPYSTDEDLEYNRNCTNCVVAYEMRCRGYDVTAKSIRENKRLQFAPFSAWIDADKQEGHSKKDVIAFMDKQPDGARVQICVNPVPSIWEDRSGHTFVAVRNNGNTVFKDPQSGVIIKTEDEDDYFKNIKSIEYARIDLLEISDKGISACKKE